MSLEEMQIRIVKLQKGCCCLKLIWFYPDPQLPHHTHAQLQYCFDGISIGNQMTLSAI